jgi:peroxiredoxin Q/BCP
MKPRTESPRYQILVVVLAVGICLGAGLATALEVGDQAPDFELPSTTGGKISLSQFRGKKLVLLEFYGADFSPV